MLVYLVNNSSKVDANNKLSAYDVDVPAYYGNLKKLKIGMLFDIDHITFEICDYKFSEVHNEWYYVYRYHVPFKIKATRCNGKDIIGNDNLK